MTLFSLFSLTEDIKGQTTNFDSVFFRFFFFYYYFILHPTQDLTPTSTHDPQNFFSPPHHSFVVSKRSSL